MIPNPLRHSSRILRQGTGPCRHSSPRLARSNRERSNGRLSWQEPAWSEASRTSGATRGDSYSDVPLRHHQQCRGGSRRPNEMIIGGASIGGCPIHMEPGKTIFLTSQAQQLPSLAKSRTSNPSRLIVFRQIIAPLARETRREIFHPHTTYLRPVCSNTAQFNSTGSHHSVFA